MSKLCLCVPLIAWHGQFTQTGSALAQLSKKLRKCLFWKLTNLIQAPFTNDFQPPSNLNTFSVYSLSRLTVIFSRPAAYSWYRIPDGSFVLTLNILWFASIMVIMFGREQLFWADLAEHNIFGSRSSKLNLEPFPIWSATDHIRRST
ncbi:hypothetical protein BJ138DRAFT_756056 [Hygrophoropsis aurantiaca]|uniref:Uncharacterized protein n=1 Tax=Hygrophoropsis aurantiaca TaxID=72124 RepID=A0ACB8AJA7_9AGAM|nr:hypothetical protein BJ138DRAFT_756056 [Hygrophoropsis aurantiaca]